MCGGCAADIGLAVAHGFKMNRSTRRPDLGLQQQCRHHLRARQLLQHGQRRHQRPVDLLQQVGRPLVWGIDITGSSDWPFLPGRTRRSSRSRRPRGPNGSGDCGDQGKIEVSENVVAIGTNVFTNFCSPGGQYLGDRVTI
jgi:hypothetical protein